MGFVLVPRLLSAWRAGVLSSCFAKKKVAKEEGDPRVGAGRCPVPCATRQSGRLAKLACGSDNASRKPPDSLRCSAPLMGTRKASWADGSAQEETSFSSQLRENPIVGFHQLSRDAFLGPLRGAEQRRLERKKGEDCLRAQPEFRSPRSNRVAEGTGAAGTDPGSPFLCLLSFGEAKESNAAPQARKTQIKSSHTTKSQETPC